MKNFLAAVVVFLGIICLGVAVLAVAASFRPGGSHVDLSSLYRIAAIVAALSGLLFLGVGRAILGKREPESGPPADPSE